MHVGNPYAPPYGADQAAADAWEAGMTHAEEAGSGPDDMPSPYPPGPLTDAWVQGVTDYPTISQAIEAGYAIGSAGIEAEAPNELQGRGRYAWYDGRTRGWAAIAAKVAANMPAEVDPRPALTDAQQRITHLENQVAALLDHLRDIEVLRAAVNAHDAKIRQLGERFVIPGRVADYTTKANWDRIPDNAVLYYWAIAD